MIVSPIVQANKIIGDYTQQIISGELVSLRREVKEDIDDAVRLHFVELERRVEDPKDELRQSALLFLAELGLEAGNKRRDRNDVVESRDNTSHVYRPKEDYTILEQLRTRHKSSLSDFFKEVGVIQISGRTPRTYDRRGMTAIIKNPSAPHVDFNGISEEENLDAVLAHLSDWHFSGGTEKEAFVQYALVAWHKRLKGHDEELVRDFVEEYFDRYVQNGHRKISRKNRSIGKKVMAMKYWTKFKELFGEIITDDNEDRVRRLFLDSLPKSGRIGHRKGHSDSVQLIVENEGDVEDFEFKMDSYYRFVSLRPHNWLSDPKGRHTCLSDKISSKFPVPSGMITVDDIWKEYEKILKGIKFKRDYSEGVNPRGIFVLDDVFIPSYKRKFEGENVRTLKAIVEDLLGWETFGEKIEIGPRQLLFKGEPYRDVKVVAAAQDVFFPDNKKNYVAVVQRWESVDAHNHYFWAKAARVTGKKALKSSFSQKLPAGVQAIVYEANGTRNFMLAYKNINVEIQFEAPENLEVDHFQQNQVIHYMERVVENTKHKRPGLAANKVPGKSVSVMDYLLSPTQKPDRSSIDYANFPMDKLGMFTLALDRTSSDHFRKNNVDFPKVNGFQAFKINFKEMEFVLMTPVMYWHATKGPSSHNEYKNDLEGQIVAEAQKVHGSGRKRERKFRVLGEFVNYVRDSVARAYVERIEYHLGEIEANSKDKDRVRLEVKAIDDLYRRFSLEFPAERLSQINFYIDSPEKLLPRIEEGVPLALLNGGTTREIMGRTLYRLKRYGYSADRSFKKGLK